MSSRNVCQRMVQMGLGCTFSKSLSTPYPAFKDLLPVPMICTKPSRALSSPSSHTCCKLIQPGGMWTPLPQNQSPSCRLDSTHCKTKELGADCIHFRLKRHEWFFFPSLGEGEIGSEAKHGLRRSVSWGKVEVKTGRWVRVTVGGCMTQLAFQVFLCGNWVARLEVWIRKKEAGSRNQYLIEKVLCDSNIHFEKQNS